jgi:hypothetical protein
LDALDRGGTLNTENLLRTPNDERLQNLFHKRVREMTLPRVSSIAIYFFVALEFGAPLWKCFAIAAAVGYCLFVGMGRGIFVRVSVVLLILALVEFSGVMPPMSHWGDFLGTLMKRDLS